MRECFRRYHTFLLLVSTWTITCGADDITAVKAPDSVVAGTVVPVTVSYVASTDRDIMVNFQLNIDPWTNFGNNRISVTAGSSTLVIPVAINAATPTANNTYKFGVSLLPTPLAGWPDRLDTMVQEHGSCFLAPQMFTVYPAEYSGA